MLFFIITGLCVANIATFGILLPFLISYPDTLFVITGILIGIAVIFVDCKTIPKIYKKLKERVK
jgi:hypothetical protein